MMGQKCELPHQIQFIKIIVVIHNNSYKNKFHVIENNMRTSSVLPIHQPNISTVKSNNINLCHFARELKTE